MYYKQINHKVSRLISHNTYYIGCVFTFEAVLPPLWMSTKQIPTISAGLRWKFFHFVFFLINSTQYMLCTCVIGGNEKFSYETCHLEYLELGLSFQIAVIPFSPCTVWQRFQTNHAPSVYSAPPSNEKSFTLLLWWVWKVSFALEFRTKKSL